MDRVCTAGCGTRCRAVTKYRKCLHHACKDCMAHRCAACLFDERCDGQKKLGAISVGPRFDEGVSILKSFSTTGVETKAKSTLFVEIDNHSALEAKAWGAGFHLKRSIESENIQFELIDRLPVVYVTSWCGPPIPFRRRGSLHPDMERVFASLSAKVDGGTSVLDLAFRSIGSRVLPESDSKNLKWVALDPDAAAAGALIQWSTMPNGGCPLGQLAKFERDQDGNMRAALNLQGMRNVDTMGRHFSAMVGSDDWVQSVIDVGKISGGQELHPMCCKSTPPEPEMCRAIVWMKGKTPMLFKAMFEPSGIEANIWNTISSDSALGANAVATISSRLGLQPRGWVSISVDALVGAALSAWSQADSPITHAMFGTMLVPRPTMENGRARMKISTDLLVPLRCLAAFHALQRHSFGGGRT